MKRIFFIILFLFGSNYLYGMETNKNEIPQNQEIIFIDNTISRDTTALQAAMHAEIIDLTKSKKRKLWQDNFTCPSNDHAFNIPSKIDESPKKARKIQNESSSYHENSEETTFINRPDSGQKALDKDVALDTVLREIAHDDSYIPFTEEYNLAKETLHAIDTPNLPDSHQENNSGETMDIPGIPDQEYSTDELLNTIYEMEINDFNPQLTQENTFNQEENIETTDITIFNIPNQGLNDDELLREIFNTIDNDAVSTSYASEMQSPENQILEEIANQDNNRNVASPSHSHSHEDNALYSNNVYHCPCKKTKTKVVAHFRKHLKNWHYDKNSKQYRCPEKSCAFISSTAKGIIIHLQGQPMRFKTHCGYFWTNKNYKQHMIEQHKKKIKQTITKQTIDEKIESLATIKKNLATLDTEEKFLKQAEYLIINYKKLLQSNKYIWWHNSIIPALVDAYCTIVNYLFTHHKYQEAMECSNKIREECSLLGYDKYPAVAELLRSLEVTLLSSNNSMLDNAASNATNVADTSAQTIPLVSDVASDENFEEFLDSLLI